VKARAYAPLEVRASLAIGQRVPHRFFATSGVGQSDVTAHAGSFHLALREAGIESQNIMRYSSILPGSAVEVLPPERQQLVHGAVMETIMATADTQRGDRATAGLIWGWLVDPWDGSRYGGLVAEYQGPRPPDEVPEHMRDMLTELHENGYEHLMLEVDNALVRSIEPTHSYGTAVVALCFLDHTIRVGRS
jgi:arginine decarboxylase